jgi:hypothetical protein
VKISGFGIRREGLRHQPMHQCWDMTTFTPTTTTKLLGGKKIIHETLLAFALDVREWAHTQDLQLRNSLSGYASQLQRDKRFYPDSRCKVPTATNERARNYLPGNLVKLYVDPNTRYAYNVTSIDQRSAHHQIVQDISLPNANTLHARGYFHNPDNATKLGGAIQFTIGPLGQQDSYVLTYPHDPQNRESFDFICKTLMAHAECTFGQTPYPS